MKSEPPPRTETVEHLSLDHDLRVTAASDEFLAALGSARDRVLGHHIAEVVGPGAEAARFQVLGAIAGSVAHDFNNLLTVIQGNIDAACCLLPVDSPARCELQLAQLAGRRAADLIAQVLDASALEDVDADLELRSVVEEALPLLRRVVGDDVHVDLLAAATWPVRVRRSHVEQILLNLAVNAREAMLGGGTLVLELHNAKVTVIDARAGLPAGDYAVIACGDSGCGMDANTLQHLFEPFFTTKKRGTGLGLATVARIVERVGGRIRVDSEPGAGARFEIYLPRAWEKPSLH